MRTETASGLSFMLLLGGVALLMGGVGCQQDGPRTSGSGGAQSGGSGGNDSGGSGGANEGGSGGSGEGGSGGSASGGSGGSGSGGSEQGGSGSGGSDQGGSGAGQGGSGEGGSEQGGQGGSGEGGSEQGGCGSGGSDQGGSGGSGQGGSGSGGSGGSVSGCSGAIKPSNGSEGGVTDFTDYSTTSGKWGSTSALYGSVYGYPGTNGSTMKASVDTTAKNLHATGNVTAGDYAGFGLSFEVCATVEAFTQVQFTVAGSVGDCNLELQVKTFDQTPTTASPPGGCDSSSTSCYGFPSLQQVAVPSSTATDVVKPLADLSSWSAASATQVLGLQWQVTSNLPPEADAGTGCPIDVTVTNIKFLP